MRFFPCRFDVVFLSSKFPKDDRAEFAQKEQLGLPYWTMISATRVLVGVSKNLGFLIFGIFQKKLVSASYSLV